MQRASEASLQERRVVSSASCVYVFGGVGTRQRIDDRVFVGCWSHKTYRPSARQSGSQAARASSGGDVYERAPDVNSVIIAIPFRPVKSRGPRIYRSVHAGACIRLAELALAHEVSSRDWLLGGPKRRGRTTICCARDQVKPANQPSKRKVFGALPQLHT